MRITIADFKNFCNAICEFAGLVSTPSLFERKLEEYGKLIIKEQAISTSLKYFK